jgi:hypothetical protein
MRGTEKHIDRNRTLGQLLLKRQDFVQLLLLGAVMALGVNLVAGIMFQFATTLVAAEYHTPVQAALFAVAIALVAVSAIIAGHLLLGGREITVSAEAVLVVEQDTAALVPIAGYKFTEKMAATLRAVFLENDALRQQWSQLAPSKQPSQTTQDAETATSAKRNVDSETHRTPTFMAITRVRGEPPSIDPQAASLLREAVEFVVLEQLSTHLSTYFSDRDDEDKFISELKREDVPEVLIRNRVLSLLSEPLENRAVFLKYAAGGTKLEGEVILVQSSDGALYSRFDLVLPAGTTVSRPAPNQIRLKNNRLVVELQIDYEGFHTSLPSALVHFWTGKNFSSCQYHMIRLSFRGHVSPLALLRPAGWKDHQWVDSFGERLRRFADKDSFLDRINWDSLDAQIRVNIVLQRSLLRAIRHSNAAKKLSSDGDTAQSPLGQSNEPLQPKAQTDQTAS